MPVSKANVRHTQCAAMKISYLKVINSHFHYSIQQPATNLPPKQLTKGISNPAATQLAITVARTILQPGPGNARSSQLSPNAQTSENQEENI